MKTHVHCGTRVIRPFLMPSEMRLLAAVGLATFGLAIAPKALGNTVSLYQNPYTYDGGAEITAIASPSYLGNYASVATQTVTAGTGFETFCVEQNVDADPATTYSFTLAQTTSDGHTLTEGAAYLYYLFGEGLLGSGGTPSYNYANTGGTRSADAESLQTALWVLLGEPNLFGQNLATDTYLQYALTTLGSSATNPNNGTYPVDVMQLWDSDNPGQPSPNGYQNQLVITASAPDGGSTVLMLGSAFTLLGLAGVRGNKRRA